MANRKSRFVIDILQPRCRRGYVKLIAQLEGEHDHIIEDTYLRYHIEDPPIDSRRINVEIFQERTCSAYWWSLAHKPLSCFSDHTPIFLSWDQIWCWRSFRARLMKRMLTMRWSNHAENINHLGKQLSKASSSHPPIMPNSGTIFFVVVVQFLPRFGRKCKDLAKWSTRGCAQTSEANKILITKIETCA